MKKANIFYVSKNKPTVDLMVKVGKEKFDIEFSPVTNSFLSSYPAIYCGLNDNFDLSKDETLEFLEDVMENTMVIDGELGDYDLAIVKENGTTSLKLFKDIDMDNYDDISIYRYIKNKNEWRINVSYGVINQVLNKNIGSEIFGKADITQWTAETDKEVRTELIDYAKDIWALINEAYPKIEHFGIDIIQDKDDGTYYLLEVNRANGLNEESVEYLLKGFVKKYFNTTTSQYTVENNYGYTNTGNTTEVDYEFDVNRYDIVLVNGKYVVKRK